MIPKQTNLIYSTNNESRNCKNYDVIRSFQLQNNFFHVCMFIFSMID